MLPLESSNQRAVRYWALYVADPCPSYNGNNANVTVAARLRIESDDLCLQSYSDTHVLTGRNQPSLSLSAISAETLSAAAARASST